MIIGLSGHARSGKDEAAKVLVEEFGFTRVAFADKLRDFLYALNPPVVSWFQDSKDEVAVQVSLKEVIDEHGWDGYKETTYGTIIRGLLQRLGTEAGRKVLSDSLWIDAAFKDVRDDGNYVFTDVRFENEASAIRERGGSLWRVTRDGVGPATAEDGSVHKSEISLDHYSFDYYLPNNGSLENYQITVRNLAKLGIKG